MWEVIAIVEIFRALSEESRLRILALLMQEEMCVCEIENCLELTQSNASRHLTILKNAGILTSTKKAQWIYYKVSEEFKRTNQELFSYISEKIKQIPGYDADIEQLQKCRIMDLCNSKD